MAAPQHIEIVQRVNEAFNSGDVERVVALVDPDFHTSVPAQLSAEPDTYRGPEGIRRYFASFREVMDEIHFGVESAEQFGAEVVISLRVTARGRTTGIPVEQRLAQVWSFRDGKAVEVRSFASMSEAVEAAGPGSGR